MYIDSKILHYTEIYFVTSKSKSRNRPKCIITYLGPFEQSNRQPIYFVAFL